ncbi:hypothetical protein FSP39_008036 [Pinctada imbricata]|uniref:Hexosyltransferase n=1 Tax=Pinctada imbricata TaxID=66713 RepID=A0AA88XVW0_PINIB|nr:hypothetical protein FSP39_008036 [Pinctada imbricata]
MRRISVLPRVKKHAGILICLLLFSLNTLFVLFPLPYGNGKVKEASDTEDNIMRSVIMGAKETSRKNALSVAGQENRYETRRNITESTLTTKRSKPWCEEVLHHYPMALDYRKLLSSSVSSISSPIHLHPYQYIFNPTRVCNTSNEIFILSVVKSKIDHFILRMAIRATWGRKANSKNNRLVFLLGNSKNSTIRYDVRQEFKMHGDLVMENFIDSYYNNTIKTTMGVRWIAEFCEKARYVVFVDEDVMVLYPNLLKFFGGLIKYQELQLFEGEIHTDAGPHRNSTSKWYVSKGEYPFDCYPPFLSGGTILTSGNVVQKLNTAIPYVKPLKLDDVYLSIVANKVGITPKNNVKVCMGVNKSFRDEFITKHGFVNHYLNIGNMLHKRFTDM